MGPKVDWAPLRIGPKVDWAHKAMLKEKRLENKDSSIDMTDLEHNAVGMVQNADGVVDVHAVMCLVCASGRSVTTVTRAHAGCLPLGPRHQTNLSYEPGRDKRGLLRGVVLTVLMA